MSLCGRQENILSPSSLTEHMSRICRTISCGFQLILGWRNGEGVLCIVNFIRHLINSSLFLFTLSVLTISDILFCSSSSYINFASSMHCTCFTCFSLPQMCSWRHQPQVSDPCNYSFVSMSRCSEMCVSHWFHVQTREAYIVFKINISFNSFLALSVSWKITVMFWTKEMGKVKLLRFRTLETTYDSNNQKKETK